MAIEISVTDPQSDDEQKNVAPGETQTSMSLNLRKGVDGSVMIFDHEDIDIIIMPEAMKIIALPKDLITDEVYDTQNHLFKHLSKKGVVEFDSIKGGSVYGAFEALMQKSAFEGLSPIQAAIFQIGKFIEDERPYLDRKSVV